MIFYFLFVFLSVCLSIGWGLYRIKRFDYYKRPFQESVIISMAVLSIGSIWWALINQEAWMIVPGILYYFISFMISSIINWNVLSLVKPKVIVRKNG